jgi:hypothetical protein
MFRRTQVQLSAYRPATLTQMFMVLLSPSRQMTEGTEQKNRTTSAFCPINNSQVILAYNDIKLKTVQTSL